MDGKEVISFTLAIGHSGVPVRGRRAAGV